MSDVNKKNVAGVEEAVKKVASKSPEQVFVDEYNKLCEKLGYTIAPVPAWVQSKDTGDYRLVIQMNVVKIEKPQEL